MTCPHCNGTGEVQETQPMRDVPAQGPTGLVSTQTWDRVHEQMGQIMLEMSQHLIARAQRIATARALAETGHLGEAP